MEEWYELLKERCSVCEAAGTASPRQCLKCENRGMILELERRLGLAAVDE